MLSWDKIYAKNLQKKWGQEKLQEDMPWLLKFFKKNRVKGILDLGCGSGRNLVFFAKNGFDVSGIDYSKSGIKIIKLKLKAVKAKSQLIVGDIFKKLPYKNNFFDAIICVQVINHNKYSKIRRAFKEVERILKKNGFLYISVLRYSASAHKHTIASKNKKIGVRTFLPLEGSEKGVPHFMFIKSDIFKLLKNYKIISIKMNKPKWHWLVLAQKL